jgi:hypothetical protein
MNVKVASASGCAIRWGRLVLMGTVLFAHAGGACPPLTARPPDWNRAGASWRACAVHQTAALGSDGSIRGRAYAVHQTAGLGSGGSIRACLRSPPDRRIGIRREHPGGACAVHQTTGLGSGRSIRGVLARDPYHTPPPPARRFPNVSAPVPTTNPLDPERFGYRLIPGLLQMSALGPLRLYRPGSVRPSTQEGPGLTCGAVRGSHTIPTMEGDNACRQCLADRPTRGK